MFKKILLTSLSLIASNVYATNCPDKITDVVVHSNGNIYFNTQNVCSAHWCVLGTEKWNTSDKIKAGLSILLAANAAKQDVVIEWDSADVPDCSTVVSDYATPGFLMAK